MRALFCRVSTNTPPSLAVLTDWALEAQLPLLSPEPDRRLMGGQVRGCGHRWLGQAEWGAGRMQSIRRRVAPLCPSYMRVPDHPELHWGLLLLPDR